MVEVLCAICGLVVGYMVGHIHGWKDVLSIIKQRRDEDYQINFEDDTHPFPHRGHKYDKTC